MTPRVSKKRTTRDSVPERGRHPPRCRVPLRPGTRDTGVQERVWGGHLKSKKVIGFVIKDASVSKKGRNKRRAYTYKHEKITQYNVPHESARQLVRFI